MYLTDRDLNTILDTYREGEILGRLTQITQSGAYAADTEYDDDWVMGDALEVERVDEIQIIGAIARDFLLMLERFSFCEGAKRAIHWINAHQVE